MKAKSFEVLLALGLTLLLAACSSSKPKEGEMTDIIPASTDAGTDIVPEGNPESLAPGGEVKAATPEAAPAMPVADAKMPEAASSAAQMPTEAAIQPEPTPVPAPGKHSKKKHADAEQTASASPVDSGPTAPGEYSVQKGDTLMKIAFETYGDLYKWKSIYDANRDKIPDPNKIPAGTVLKVDKPVQAVAIERNGERYQIQTGDTLGKISQNVYGTPKKWKTLWENNKQLISNPNKIFAGFYLYYVPDANAPAPMASSGAGQGSDSTSPALAAKVSSKANGPAPASAPAQ